MGIIIFHGTLVAQVCPGAQGSVQWECWRNLFQGSFGELTAHEYYAIKPDVQKTLYRLDAPINFDNNFGARISGFIRIPQTDSVEFNITCNERGRFYLSTDDNPANLQLVAFTNASTNISEHDKFPEQTSQKVELVALQYYYFEIMYVDEGWSDHCRVHWKTNFLNNNNWNIITAQYIYGVDCLPTPCPERGTPCDDNNPNTTSDVEDGHCHCIGQTITSDTCVGQRGFIERFRYDNITGSSLNDLYNSAAFPGTPNFSASMSVLGVPYSSSLNNMGHLVSAYISVPVSGLYKFNVTGDDQTVFFLSSDHSPNNKLSTQARVTGWTNTTEHNKYITQTTSNVYLEAGQYYYIEVNHKEASGGEHFGVFWQTPFTLADVWKRIPAFYLYDYECNIACIPEDTPCDDGNPFTNNDAYDADCTCVGVPCSGPDCDSPLANYVPYEKCGLTDMIDNRPEASWVSCEVSESPNPARDRSHWIKYDLGERYELISSQIWNYNVAGSIHQGFENVEVDYSEDGIVWNNLGSYNWPLATGETGYGGFAGPNFNSVKAQYLLITSLDDTLTCRGLSKVAFHAVKCPFEGTLCDDNNPLTADDKYDDNCECKGINLALNPCDETIMVLQDTTLNAQVLGAEISITALSSVQVNGIVGMVAGDYIELNPGFETQLSSTFLASINPCAPSSVTNEDENILASRNSSELSYLFTKRVAETDYLDIFFRIDGKSHPKLVLTDLKNNINYYIVDNELMNKGLYRKRIRTKKLNSLDNIQLTLTNNGEVHEIKGIE